MFRFLLAALILTSFTQDPPAKQTTEPQAEEKTPTSQPATKAQYQRNPNQARILKELLRDVDQERPKPILSDPDIGLDAYRENEDESLLLEGTVLKRRLGRLVRSGIRSEFHFISSDSKEQEELIMQFNRNSLLEAMETEAEAGVRQFIITAEVTRYRGQNYLNLYKYRRQISHGNITP